MRDGTITNGAPGQMETPGSDTGGFCAVSGGQAARSLAGAAVSVAAAAALVLRARRRRRRL